MTKRRRASGEGSVFWWEKKGLWVARITLPDGKTRAKYNKKQSVVKDWLLENRNQLRQGILPADDTVTLGEFMTNYMENVAKNNLRPKTIEGYEHLIKRHINPEIGRIKLTQLRPEHLQSFYSRKVQSGLSKRTVQFMHSIIHKTLKQALKWGVVNRNVAALVEAPKPTKRPPTIWNPEQVVMFLQATKNHRFGLVFLLALTLGLREGEVLGIHRENVSTQDGTIKVLHQVQSLRGGMVITEPKTESSKRLITVPQIAMPALKAHIEAMGSQTGLIFHTSTGKPISPGNMVKAFKAEAEKLGLPKIRFHDLRHTSASLIASKVHPKILQMRLGHSVLSTTYDIYAHLFQNMQNEASAEIDKVLGIP